jgi:hypothetical protein
LPHVRHDATGGYLVPYKHTVELLEQKPIGQADSPVVSFRKKLSLGSVVGGLTLSGTIYKSALDDARRVVETMRDFLDDSRAVLARSCGHCCICGRGLADELSRSRGIGPECIKSADVVAVLINPAQSTFVAPETAKV